MAKKIIRLIILGVEVFLSSFAISLIYSAHLAKLQMKILEVHGEQSFQEVKNSFLK
jgi:hypothetical protein